MTKNETRNCVRLLAMTRDWVREPNVADVSAITGSEDPHALATALCLAQGLRDAYRQAYGDEVLVWALANAYRITGKPAETAYRKACKSYHTICRKARQRIYAKGCHGVNVDTYALAEELAITVARDVVTGAS